MCLLLISLVFSQISCYFHYGQRIFSPFKFKLGVFFFFLSFSTWSVLVNVSSVHEKNVYSVGYSILYVSVLVSCWYYLALCVTTDVLYACFINYWESNCRFVYLLTSVSFYFMYFEALIRYTHLGLLCLNELTYHYEMSLLHITFFFLEFCV